MLHVNCMACRETSSEIHRLKKCEVFRVITGFNCKNCGCSYKKHLHIYYETELVTKYKQDERINKRLEGVVNNKTAVEELLNNLDKYCRELHDEYHLILNTSAKFALFLKHNAITPYNDTFKVINFQKFNFLNLSPKNVHLVLSQFIAGERDEQKGFKRRIGGENAEHAERV